MAVFVYDNASVVINAVDLSDHVKSATLNYEGEMLDDTVMGDDTRSSMSGLKKWSLEVEFLNDEAAGSVAATLFALIGAAAVTVAVRPENDTIGATNPEYTGSAVLASFMPTGGSVGELATTTARFESAGTLVRDVTP